MKEFSNPTYWAKVSGVIRASLSKMDDYDKSLFAPLANMTGEDMVRLACGYHDTEWMSNIKTK